MTSGFNPQPFYSSSGKRLLDYISSNEIVLDLTFIMTVNKRLPVNMPYLKVENGLLINDITAIRLLYFETLDSIVQLNVQELESKKCYTLEWNMDYEGTYWLWALADFKTIITLAKEKYEID